jgi:hypothetical protein
MSSHARQRQHTILEAQLSKPRHVLILVENLPVPFDRRVWQEAQALRQDGHSVSVICPKGKGHTAAYEVLDGVHIYRHALVEATSARGYPAEYLTALAHQLRLSLRVKRRQRIDVIQACNPPDLLFLVALFHRVLFGTRSCSITTILVRSSISAASAGRTCCIWCCVSWNG